MKVKFIEPRGNAPEKLLANAEIADFIKGAPMVKIVDIAIWVGNDGPWVAWPGRQYTDKTGAKKTARFVRPVGEEWGDLNRLNDFILAEYKKWAKDRPEPGLDEESGDDENPFA